MHIDITMAEMEGRAIFMTIRSHQRSRSMSVSSFIFSTARYARGMESIADQHRRDDAAALADLSPAERVSLALELGDQDREIFRDSAGLSEEAALHELRRRRQIGRTPCSFFEDEP
jgi:hypothetical protein